MGKMMKRIFVISFLAIAGLAVAQNKDSFLSQKFNEWFAEAKPATKAIWVTDAKGCLHSIYDAGNGIQIVAMLDKDKKPVCRK